MNLSPTFRSLLLGLTLLTASFPAMAQDTSTASSRATRVVGVVRDETNAIALPGVPVEVVGTSQVVYTDVDGRYVLELPPGTHDIKVAMEGYQQRTLKLEITGRASGR